MKTNRIKYVNPSNSSFNGLTGSILQIDRDRSVKYTFLIQFDKNVGGHDGEGLGKEGHCF